MIEVAKSLLAGIFGLFKSRSRLQAENLVLRHQVNILRRRGTKRLRLTAGDRALFDWICRLFPSLLDAMAIVRPETVVRWHRRSFRALWRWKSRGVPGRPRIPKDVQNLIREISLVNPLWGAPRIHGELLKLGIEIAPSTVARYMARRRSPPSQFWKTFLKNHADGIAAIDFFVVSTIGFKFLFGLVVLRHGRRLLIHVGATSHPTAEWIARQISEAFPWDSSPSYLIRDRDGAYGLAFKRRLGAIGIRDRPTAPRSPWQNGYVERLIGSIRRECLDHVIVLNERHLRRILVEYANYYNNFRTHRSLRQDAPVGRPVLRRGEIRTLEHLGGLHHSFVRT